MSQIAPKDVRYIKLGRAGGWEKASLDQGELHFGYSRVPDDLCRAGRWEDVVDLLIKGGRSLSKARDAVREIRDFYELGPDCLWITFVAGHLWWSFAAPGVIPLAESSDDHGARVRKTIDGWHNADTRGHPLRIGELSSRLTQTAGYRQTICRVKAEDYLLRRINAAEEPIVMEAREAKARTIAAATEMITQLHWADFETLVDLIFSRSGWQRTSRVGETMKDVDLVLRQPTTGETAFVQVKSTADQRVLDTYVDQFIRSGAYDRMYFLCHTPANPLRPAPALKVHVWSGEYLADAAVSAGLFDWLIARSG